MEAILDILSQKMENRFRRYRDYCIKGEKSLHIENELLKQESQYRVNTVQRERKIIVSLTSFPARFEKLHLVIRSLLVQTMPPDAIILYLDDDVEELPDSLRKLEKYGLQIEWRPGRIKPHKKYYYAIKEHPDDIVVTVDDDVMYPAELIESLYKTHRRFPDCVVATRAHRILFNNHKTIRSYNNWHWADEHRNKPSLALMATGVGGVLYPPRCMNEELLNQKLFLKLSPNGYVRGKIKHLIIPYMIYLMLDMLLVRKTLSVHDWMYALWGGRAVTGVYWYITCFLFTLFLLSTLLKKFSDRTIKSIALIGGGYR